MFGFASLSRKSLVTPLIEPLEARQFLSAGTHHAYTKHVRLHRSVTAASVVSPPVVTSPNPRLIIGTGLVIHAITQKQFTCVVASFDPLRELSPQVMQQQSARFQINATVTWADGTSNQGTLQWNELTRRWDVCATHTCWSAGALNFTVTVTISPIPPRSETIPLFGTRVIAFAESTAVAVDPPPPPVSLGARAGG